ncbi:MAG: Rieske (2Fe-2S) protein [Archangiaceae bacterium]|nr:Rieske (2Fe-2S) protein [Archangiaceae bacterium]
MAESPKAERRGFLKLLAGALAAAAGALATVPVLGSVVTPLMKPKADDGGLLRAVSVTELQDGVPRRVELVSTVIDGWSRAVGVIGAVWLLKKPDGTVSALSTICPHSGCSINQKTKSTYGCPCHDSTFELDGNATDGPSPRPMDPLEVQVKDKDVFVKYRRFKIGVKEKQELGAVDCPRRGRDLA